MEKIKITRRMLLGGMQGRIKVQEIERFNKEVDEFKEFEKKEKKFDSDEIVNIILKPKLKKVRSYRGFI